MAATRTTKQTVVLSIETLIELKTLAVRTGTTQGELIARAVVEFIEREKKTTKKG